MISLAPSLVIAGLVQLSCQAFKLLFYSLRDGKFTPRYFVSAGGMPSAHAAFGVSVAACVAVFSGPGSDVFAVAAVFAAIVIFDAVRLRSQVQGHAVLLNRLRKLLPEAERGQEQSEMVGHSMAEVLVGIGVALALALPAALLWKQAL